jgi:hypothetical protein
MKLTRNHSGPDPRLCDEKPESNRRCYTFLMRCHCSEVYKTLHVAFGSIFFYFIKYSLSKNIQ